MAVVRSTILKLIDAFFNYHLTFHFNVRLLQYRARIREDPWKENVEERKGGKREREKKNMLKGGR